MDLNQITLDTGDVERTAAFYEALGLKRIVWSAPRYARFECPSGSATLSLHHVDAPETGATALYFEVDHVDETVASLKSGGPEFRFRSSRPILALARSVVARSGRTPNLHLSCGA